MVSCSPAESLNGSQSLKDGQLTYENLRALPFNKKPSIDNTFRQIHLAVDCLQACFVQLYVFCTEREGLATSVNVLICMESIHRSVPDEVLLAPFIIQYYILRIWVIFMLNWISGISDPDPVPDPDPSSKLNSCWKKVVNFFGYKLKFFRFFAIFACF